ncbi:thrombospondin-related anonymous protein, partial [Hepatocystis sp. ex Piliocolobus tephrosceles]
WSTCSASCGKGIKTKKRMSNHESCIDTLTEECDEGECPIPESKSKEPAQSNINEYQNSVQKFVKSHNAYIPQHDIIKKHNIKIYPYQSNTSLNQNDAHVHNNIKSNNEDEEQNENNKKNQKPGVNNAYKIAGVILGGIVLLGCVGVAYSYAQKTEVLASLSSENLFDNMSHKTTNIKENDEFHIPEDDAWQGISDGF